LRTINRIYSQFSTLRFEIHFKKQIDDKIKNLEKAVAQAKAEKVTEEKKVAEVNAKIAAVTADITKAEEVVKEKQTVEKAFAQKVQAAKKAVK
jgi:hypothetical protein